MGHEHNEPHITPLSLYLKIYGTLLVLTVITVAISLVNLGLLNTPIAMLIATIKVFLVMAYFMHLKHEGFLNRLTIGSAFFFVVLFFTLTAMDVFTRVNYHEIGLEEKTKQAQPQSVIDSKNNESKVEEPKH